MIIKNKFHFKSIALLHKLGNTIDDRNSKKLAPLKR